MNMHKIGVIRVITLSDPEKRDLHGKLIEKYIPWMKTVSCSILDQPEGIHSLITKALAVPKIIETARAMKEEHPDISVITVSCADDPGVLELKEIMDIPVIGAGSSAAAIARRYGAKTGIIGITDYAPEPFERFFGNCLINLGKPEGVNSTLDLMSEEGKKQTIRKALELKSAGALSISLACTGMSTIGIAGALERATGLPVIDPVEAEAVCACYECLRYGRQE